MQWVAKAWAKYKKINVVSPLLQLRCFNGDYFVSKKSFFVFDEL